MKNVEVFVFARVKFTRVNLHIGNGVNEPYVAIWMADASNNFYVTFQDRRCEFARHESTQIDSTFILGGSIREEYAADDNVEIPSPLLDLPSRNVVIRPIVGGYKCEAINEKREAKKNARLAKLFGR
jgi:hypothetical protein